MSCILINALEFKEYVGVRENLWSLLKGQKASHEKLGDGDIVDVVLSKTDFPRIVIQFHGNEVKHWSPESFKSGKISFFLPSHLGESIEQWRLKIMDEDRKKNDERERFDSLSAEQKEIEKLRLASEKHRANLEKLGIVSKGISQGFTEAKEYESHCWKPHQKILSSALHFKCKNCGWLICDCGSCGCGRLVHYMRNS